MQGSITKSTTPIPIVPRQLSASQLGDDFQLSAFQDDLVMGSADIDAPGFLARNSKSASVNSLIQNGVRSKTMNRNQHFPSMGESQNNQM